jgi:hypothetical protein
MKSLEKEYLSNAIDFQQISLEKDPLIRLKLVIIRVLLQKRFGILFR